MGVFLQDLRYSLRTFRQSPGFAMVAVLALAFGIGVNSAIFTLLNAIALRPLPVRNAGEVVTVYQVMQGLRSRNTHGSRAYLSYHEYAAYRDQNHVFHRAGGACLDTTGARRIRIAAADGLPGLLQLFSGPVARLDDGARIPAVGVRRTGLGSSGGAQSSTLEGAIRGRSAHSWTDDRAEPRQLHGGGCRARGLPRRQHHRRRCVGAALGAGGMGAGPELSQRHQHELAGSGRAVEARCLAGVRPSGPGGDRRGSGSSGSPKSRSQDYAPGGPRRPS